MAQKRILFVSDSLGTPIHARGIFNFSCGVVQILSDLGFKIDLLVEPPTAGISGHMTARSATRLEAIKEAALVTDVFRHFGGERFRFDWQYTDPSFQRLCELHPDVAELQLAVEDGRRVSSQLQVSFKKEYVTEYIRTNQTQHLYLFDGALISQGVYSESFRRSIYSLKPVVIDAAGYDFVFVDTPHAIDFINIDDEKVAFVVHDVIPLFEVTLGYDWREMFVNKLSATARTGRNGIFVSETTRNYFTAFYGDMELRTSSIVYPPVRKEVVESARIRGRRTISDYIRGIEGNKAAEFANYALLQSSEASATGKRWRTGLNQAAEDSGTKWIGTLPYFCTVLSDEPRKNIKVLVEASRKLVGRANIIVMGQIDGNAHMNKRPEQYPNLHFTGYVSDIQKFDLLSACEAFIFPSFSEGFGIPIIEAALFGAPVICSDIPVFREVTNGLATFFDPASSDDLVEKIEDMLHNPDARNSGMNLSSFASQHFVQDSIRGRLAEIFQRDGS